ncbi:MAG TPA: hypothetical protein VK463_10715 [Desulfomonilaceae bacterium]|nr:hypothetical protein [Desulfomonilaceae bacterium]
MNRQNDSLPCIIFPMGVEAYQFLGRVEVLQRWKRGKATYRKVFFEGRHLLVVRCGMGPERAATAVRHLDEAPAAILCAGSAGGLVPDLTVGDLVVSSETVAGDAPCDIVAGHVPLVENIVRVCRRENRNYRIGRVVTVNNAVFPKEDRRRLHRETGAAAVDMESHAIGMEAAKRSVPFAALRVISDDLDSPSLPDIRDFKHIWRRPLELHRRLPELWRWRAFLRDFRRAVSVLHPVLVGVLRDVAAGRK